MKRFGLIVVTMCLALWTPAAGQTTAREAAPEKVIFDTDMGNDVDDVLALDILYKYVDAGKIDLLAVMSSKDSEGSAPFIDIMNTFYGHPHMAVGVVRHGALGGDPKGYDYKVWKMKEAQGRPLFRTSIKDYTKLPDAHLLYRKILAKQPDHSVTIISVGFSTNLARLLLTGPDRYSRLTGRELVARKVKGFSLMAGDFATRNPEFNVKCDIASAQMFFALCPVPIVTSPFDVGLKAKYPATSIERDFGWAARHPLVEAYCHYLKMPYDACTWDPTAVVNAVEPGRFMDTSEPGVITVDAQGTTTFKPQAGGMHRYLKMSDRQARDIMKFYLETIPSKPKAWKH